MIDRVGWRCLRLACRAAVAERLELNVEGRSHLPDTGPLLIAARHYHHLYDGCVLLATVPRHMHILVALDWVQDRRIRGLMELLCRQGRWPAVLRRDRGGRLEQPEGIRTAYRPDEGDRLLRQAARMATDLLSRDRALLVFPEAYPNIDPVFTPKRRDDEILPFRDGVVRLARHAARMAGSPVPVVPAGLAYRREARWRVTLRFGAPLLVGPASPVDSLTASLEAAVRTLSDPGGQGERSTRPVHEVVEDGSPTLTMPGALSRGS